MSSRWVLASVLVLVGCLHTATEECPDGSVCARDTLCVPRDALHLEDGYACIGHEPRCGDGRIDAILGETCDDGDTLATGGCSADCRSTLVCGNGIIDPSEGETCDEGDGFAHDGCDPACHLESPTWALLDVAPPAFDTYPAIAYDARRDRVVVFGGHREPEQATLVAETWELDPRGGWHLIRTPTSPSPRAHAAMAYDAARKVVVLFGGHRELPPGQPLIEVINDLNDTWTWDGTSWVPLTLQTRPPIRRDAAMAYDPESQRIVLHGGQARDRADPHTGELQTVYRDDTWEWDGTQWVDVSIAAGPDTRSDFGMVYVPWLHGVAVLGGFDGTAVSQELMNVRVYGHGHAWASPLTTAPPPPSASTRIAYDTRDAQVVLVGGDSAVPDLRESTWKLDATLTWTRQTAAPGSPQPPNHLGRGAIAALDGSVILCGGDPSSYWEWRAGQWTERAVGAEPSGIIAVAFDRRARIVYAVDTSSNLALLSTRGWSGRIRDQGVALPGEGTTLVWDEQRATLVALNGAQTFRASLTESTVAWSFAARPPDSRYDAALTYDRRHDRVLAFGGSSAASGIAPFTDTTWAWDGSAWQTLAFTGPKARTLAALGYDPERGEVVLFGGLSLDGDEGDTWIFTDTGWSQRTTVTAPSPRRGGALVWNLERRRLTLAGGITGDSPLSDTWEWDGTTWDRVAASNPPVAEAGMVATTAPDGSGILLVEPGIPAVALHRLRWQSARPDETCTALDGDHDGITGCAEPACWNLCTPDCRPGDACTPEAPVCEAALPSCQLCDVACELCGDLLCDGAETHATCAADCPP